MYCPNCGGEFREGILRCPDCDVTLVSREPAAQTGEGRKLVTVFRTANAAVLPVLESVLDSTDIPYTVKGEELLGLFPGAGAGFAVDARSRGVEVQVPEDRAEEARNILKGVEAEDAVSDEAEEGSEEG